MESVGLVKSLNNNNTDGPPARTRCLYGIMNAHNKLNCIINRDCETNIILSVESKEKEFQSTSKLLDSHKNQGPHSINHNTHCLHEKPDLQHTCKTAGYTKGNTNHCSLGERAIPSTEASSVRRPLGTNNSRRERSVEITGKSGMVKVGGLCLKRD